MNDRLHQLLSQLCESLDVRRQAEIGLRYRDALDWRPVARPPLVVTYPLPGDASFPPYPHRETFDHPEKMLYNELTRAFDTSIALHADVADDLPLTIRANFGTVLVASMFGAPVQQRDDNPPWIVHGDTHGISLDRIADTDPSDLWRGWVPRAAAAMQFYREALDAFPVLKESIRIVLPDLQGPIDSLELIRGSDVLMELAAAPEAVDRAMTTLATAQINLARYFRQWTTEPAEGYCHQHAVMIKGNLLIRNDTSIMVSPKMYRQQIRPHDERVLRESGGGGVHSCGNVGHLVDEYLNLPSIRSLDLGQSELNDLDTIYAKAAAKHVPLIRLAVTEAEILSGDAWRRFPTGAVLIHRAKDYKSACHLFHALEEGSIR